MLTQQDIGSSGIRSDNHLALDAVERVGMNTRGQPIVFDDEDDTGFSFRVDAQGSQFVEYRSNRSIMVVQQRSLDAACKVGRQSHPLIGKLRGNPPTGRQFPRRRFITGGRLQRGDQTEYPMRLAGHADTNWASKRRLPGMPNNLSPREPVHCAVGNLGKERARLTSSTKRPAWEQPIVKELLRSCKEIVKKGKPNR
jgi:hypothetical protein